MSHRLQVLIPPELDTQIDQAAQRSRVSKGEWVRRALEASLRRGCTGSKINPVERMAALGGPAPDIDEILTEIDEGRR
jgi:hypothetical protein